MRLHILRKNSAPPWLRSVSGGTLVLLFAGAVTCTAQSSMEPMRDSSDQNSQAAQIAQLRAEVAKLQASAQQSGSARKKRANPKMKMTAEARSSTGMGDEQGGNMPPAAAPAMGMCCMGGKSSTPMGSQGGMGTPAAQPAGSMAGTAGPSSATPGQPGESRLYHIGSDGFFLNHSRHITLTQDQRANLGRLKERAMFDRASDEKGVDQAEKELYDLTGADRPDNSKIQAKVDEIEKLRAEQRMNFIRAVSDATNVLTQEQQHALLGTMAAGKM